MNSRRCRICKKEIEAHTSDESYVCLMEVIESFCDLYNHQWVFYNFENYTYLDNSEDLC